MKIKGLTLEQLKQGVEQFPNIDFGYEPVKKGNYFTVKLKVKSSKGDYHRLGQSGRRITSLCWHGFRDVMIAWFNMNPKTKIISAKATYDGIADFKEKFEATGGINIGSLVYPVTYREACECCE